MTDQGKEKYKIYKNVFDDFAIQTLNKLSGQGHFDSLLSPVMIGKESNIFLADKDDDFVIVKIYRLANCNFNKMYSYIKSDPRFQDIKNRRRLVILRWVQREYRNLMLAREGINVPMPIAFANNILVMECIGGDNPSPQLKDKYPADQKDFSEKIIASIIKLAKLGLVHGDISEFNILNHNELPYFIDFSQATSIDDPSAMDYMERDLANIKRFFAKHKFDVDVKKPFEAVKKMKKVEIMR